MKLQEKLHAIQTNINFLEKKSIANSSKINFAYNKESQILKLVKEYFSKYDLTYKFEFNVFQYIPEARVLLINAVCVIEDSVERLRFNDVFSADFNGRMSSSQAIGAAKTYGIKYFFSKLFGISDDANDPDLHMNKDLKEAEDLAIEINKQLVADKIDKAIIKAYQNEIGKLKQNKTLTVDKVKEIADFFRPVKDDSGTDATPENKEQA